MSLASLLSNVNRKRRLFGKYNVIDRSTGHKKMCMVLCGYKEILWDELFGRLKKFVINDMDIVLLTSGMYSEKINKIAESNGWSYLYTKENKVTLIQNLAINYFSSAELIFKLDEDIFLTEGFFDMMLTTYNNVSENGHYEIGFVAPLLPVNGYCHIRVLEKLGKIDEYEKIFGRTFYSSNKSNNIMVKPEAAQYMWKLTYELDDLAKTFRDAPFEYSVCPCRYSIGAILFSRQIWKHMGMFKVDSSNGLGRDEEQFCQYCMLFSKAIIVSENTLAGHFSFGPQNQVMEKLYAEKDMLRRLF